MSQAPSGEVPLLYGYWRSSSAYRVRIALNLKGIDYRQQSVHLVKNGGEQHSPEYRSINPLGLVPALRHGETTVVQSVAICEYLEEVFGGPSLLPGSPAQRAAIRAFVQSITSEVQPLNNLAVMHYLKQEMGQDDAAYTAWYQHWIARVFAALEQQLGPVENRFCFSAQPSLADCFLIPQVYNAERFKCDLTPYPRLQKIAAACRAEPAFIASAPEQQDDAPV